MLTRQRGMFVFVFSTSTFTSFLQMSPSVAQQAAANLHVEKGDDLFAIAQRMNRFSDDRDGHGGKLTPMKLCINLALMSEPTYFEKIMAACVVADFILRHIVKQREEVRQQINLHVHPFSIILDKDNNPLKLDLNSRIEFKNGYNCLLQLFAKHIKLESYDNFFRKVQKGRNVFSIIARTKKGTSTTSKFL